jgi:Stress responsive A/B Barrel Domain
MFIHHVYFWLKPGTPTEAKERLVADCRSLLRRIPGVEQLWAGEPAGTARDVVDHSYSVAMAVVLPDAAAHDVYQKHPLHLEFIERNKSHWERVRVFDFNG